MRGKRDDKGKAPVYFAERVKITLKKKIPTKRSKYRMHIFMVMVWSIYVVINVFID